MSMPTPATSRVVAITSVDLANRRAAGMTRTHVTVNIDISYHVGPIVITPAVGEQWCVERADRGFYRLTRKLQANAPELQTPAVEGQVHVGSSGPLELNGGQVNANGPLRLSAPAGNPPPGADAGSLVFDGVGPTYSDGTTWNRLATSSAVQAANDAVTTLAANTIPNTPGSVNSTLIATGAVGSSQIAGGAVGAGQIANGAVGDTQLSAGVLASLGLANSALQSLSGSPYDLSIVAFGPITPRSAGSYGDNPFGIKLQRACQLTSVTFRANTADASGNLVCQLNRNGTLITGTSTIIASANQVAGGTSSFTQTCAAGDIITVYVTAVGTTPGAGLVADVTGVMT